MVIVTTQSTCGSYSWQGNNYTSSGTYYYPDDTNPIFQLNLTIFPNPPPPTVSNTPIHVNSGDKLSSLVPYVTAQSGASLSWYDSYEGYTTVDPANVTITTTTTYYVAQISSDECFSDKAAITAFVGDPIVITGIIPDITELTVSFRLIAPVTLIPLGSECAYELNNTNVYNTFSPTVPIDGVYTHTITGLSPNTSYSVKIRVGINEQGLGTITSLPFAMNTLPSPPPVPCFAEGTRILTQHGYKAIETLDAEDRVVTADLRIVPFNLFKTATLAATTKKTAPYLIQRHAFGRNLPAAPIQLSPDHKIQIGAGRWLSAKMAARNNPLVTQCDVGAPVTYYQIECENYFKDNLIAEGLVVESYGTIKATGGKKDIYTWNEELQALTRPADFDRKFANKSA